MPGNEDPVLEWINKILYVEEESLKNKKFFNNLSDLIKEGEAFIPKEIFSEIVGKKKIKTPLDFALFMHQLANHFESCFYLDESFFKKKLVLLKKAVEIISKHPEKKGGLNHITVLTDLTYVKFFDIQNVQDMQYVEAQYYKSITMMNNLTFRERDELEVYTTQLRLIALGAAIRFKRYQLGESYGVDLLSSKQELKQVEEVAYSAKFRITSLSIQMALYSEYLIFLIDKVPNTTAINYKKHQSSAKGKFDFISIQEGECINHMRANLIEVANLLLKLGFINKTTKILFNTILRNEQSQLGKINFLEKMSAAQKKQSALNSHKSSENSKRPSSPFSPGLFKRISSLQQSFSSYEETDFDRKSQSISSDPGKDNVTTSHESSDEAFKILTSPVLKNFSNNKTVDAWIDEVLETGKTLKKNENIAPDVVQLIEDGRQFIQKKLFCEIADSLKIKRPIDFALFMQRLSNNLESYFYFSETFFDKKSKLLRGVIEIISNHSKEINNLNHIIVLIDLAYAEFFNNRGVNDNIEKARKFWNQAIDMYTALPCDKFLENQEDKLNIQMRLTVLNVSLNFKKPKLTNNYDEGRMALCFAENKLSRIREIVYSRYRISPLNTQMDLYAEFIIFLKNNKCHSIEDKENTLSVAGNFDSLNFKETDQINSVIPNLIEIADLLLTLNFFGKTARVLFDIILKSDEMTFRKFNFLKKIRAATIFYSLSDGLISFPYEKMLSEEEEKLKKQNDHKSLGDSKIPSPPSSARSLKRMDSLRQSIQGFSLGRHSSTIFTPSGILTQAGGANIDNTDIESASSLPGNGSSGWHSQ